LHLINLFINNNNKSKEGEISECCREKERAWRRLQCRDSCKKTVVLFLLLLLLID